jgi:tetratricopeptide (TPR) repeat protein
MVFGVVPWQDISMDCLLRFQHQMIAVLCAAVAATGGAACTGTSPGKPEFPPRVGSVHRAEDHTSTFFVWWRAGVRDQVILHVDAHDDMQAVPDGDLERLRSLLAEGKVGQAERNVDLGPRSPMSMGDWIYVAHRVGMVQRVLWVVPETDPATLPAFLERSRPTLQERASFTRQGDWLVGTLNGFEVELVPWPALARRLIDLPQPRRLLLSLDLDFFPAAAERSHRSPRAVADELLDLLSSQPVELPQVVVSYSTNRFYTPLADRVLGDYLANALQDPGFRSSLPASWRLFFSAQDLQRQNQIAGAREQYLQVLGQDPAFTPAIFALALLRAEQGDWEGASAWAQRAVAQDASYVLAFVQLAERAEDRQRIDWSETYLGQAVEQGPDNLDAWLARAGFLRGHGCQLEACEAYRRALELAQHVSTLLFAGESCALAGYTDEALQHYREGLDLLPLLKFTKQEMFPGPLAVLDAVLQEEGER